MPNAVAIKVVIGLRANGYADHPDWTQLDLGGDTPEQHQIVKWKYDKTSGHDDDTAESPKGQQLGMMLVSQTFADKAVALFPGVVSRMTETECQDFWDNKAHAHLPEDRINTGLLNALRSEYVLIKELIADLPDGAAKTKLQNRLTRVRNRALKALDPTNAEDGVRAFTDKTWAKAKAARNITFIEPA